MRGVKFGLSWKSRVGMNVFSFLFKLVKCVLMRVVQ